MTLNLDPRYLECVAFSWQSVFFWVVLYYVKYCAHWECRALYFITVHLCNLPFCRNLVLSSVSTQPWMNLLQRLLLWFHLWICFFFLLLLDLLFIGSFSEKMKNPVMKSSKSCQLCKLACNLFMWSLLCKCFSFKITRIRYSYCLN